MLDELMLDELLLDELLHKLIPDLLPGWMLVCCRACFSDMFSAFFLGRTL